MRRGDGCITYSFICLYAGAVNWQPSCSASILLHYAHVEATSVLVLFVIFGGLFIVDCYIGRP